MVFTEADKGGATVILDVENSIEKPNKELNNENYYKKLNYDTAQEHTKIINGKIKTFQLQQIL